MKQKYLRIVSIIISVLVHNYFYQLISIVN